MLFLSGATVPVVPSLPGSPVAGSLVYYNNSFHGYNGSGWLVLNNNNLTKTDVGLGNVDNTSDANKPVSSATQTALNGKASTGSIVSSGLTTTTATILGRTTASTGAIEQLSGTSATALLDSFTTSLKGLVPASGGGSVNYLRADGSWTSPADSPVLGRTLTYSNGALVTVTLYLDAAKTQLYRTITLVRTGSVLTSVETRNSGGTLISTKTLSYTSNVLTGVVIS